MEISLITLPRGHFRRLAVGELARHFQCRGHFGEAVFDHLELADGLAKGLTLPRPFQAFLQRQLSGHVGHQGQARRALEVAHDAGEAHVLAPINWPTGTRQSSKNNSAVSTPTSPFSSTDGPR
jgi:hypothetical protein